MRIFCKKNYIFFLVINKFIFDLNEIKILSFIKLNRYLYLSPHKLSY